MALLSKPALRIPKGKVDRLLRFGEDFRIVTGAVLY